MQKTKRTPVETIRAADLNAALDIARELFASEVAAGATVRAKSAGSVSWFYVWHDKQNRETECLSRLRETAK